MASIDLLKILMMLDVVVELLCYTIQIDQFDSAFIILKHVHLIILHAE